MANNGFDVSGELLWGFFFVDHNKEKLLLLRNELETMGFVFAQLELVDDNLWQLHVTKTAVITVPQLHSLNEELNQIVAQF